MSETLHLSIAVFVFVMMVVGLVLTILEFRHGQPRREHDQARSRQGGTKIQRTRVATYARSAS